MEAATDDTAAVITADIPTENTAAAAATKSIITEKATATPTTKGSVEKADSSAAKEHEFSLGKNNLPVHHRPAAP
ncbi:hypothetical protein AS030_01600 [Fictibacillus enclensis]|uniref:Uncharacterized protein n=1 Tax=Fictibacillus enclensis TaxID=1017270 RepID=A0A0V8JBK1_9BACL|nr:hypothetical protein AS030_01600 [Fictibacillus enclensis]